MKTTMRRDARVAPRSIVASVLALVLMLTFMNGIVRAAEETVTSIAFETSPSTTIYISESTIQLNVIATTSANNTKDVTSSAIWTSSNPSVVKVSGGLLTPLTSGTAKISAQYGSYKISVDLTSEYRYDSITINSDGDAAPDKMDFAVGEKPSFTLSAVKGSTTTDSIADATWTSSSPSVATVSDKGEVTLIAAGETTITASYKGRKDTVVLNVSSPYSSFEISPDGLLELKTGNDTFNLKVNATKSSDGTAVDVTADAEWTSSNTGVVKVDKGVVTSVGAGTATITVTHHGVSDSITAVVRPAHEAMRITPSAEQHILLKGGPIDFSVAVPNDNNQWQTVTNATWTSSDIYVATVDSNGRVTPKEIGQTKITASYKGLTKTVVVNVYPTIDTMEAASDEIDAFVDEQVKLPSVTAMTLWEEKFDISNLVSWTSSNTSVVELKDGKWIGKQVGEAVLTASVQGKSVSVTVTISEKPLALTTDASNISLVIGKEVALPSVTVVNESGTEEDVTDKATWKASSPNLLIKAPKMKGLLKSSVTLTATYLGKTTTFKVTIEEEVTKLFIDASSLTLNTGKTKSFKVTGVYKNGNSVNLSTKVNFSLSNETVASMSNNVIKGIAEGTTVVTGTYQDKTVTVVVTVQPRLTKLTITNRTLTLAPGSALTMKVTATYDTGKVVDVTKSAIWTSSKETVATVNSSGQIAAVAKGVSTVKAVFEGKTVTVRVTVKP
ncbi:hypothetical protein FHS18_002592 [Paenibacillus phyllosphaerae]|uniref:BIG2 domain-containing protein n=1 Tax=Paenibacillus phyllosphaerae TaxID=274593 RepID=A0A7W5AXC3_9BACL|nr:Ig-like domain-containing protein [Paenibacillus phyllosphaerae]MBB3110525.1 hypothetical protein [Paenibacillus phyllosphaerae]